jgi:hypothetical protein
MGFINWWKNEQSTSAPSSSQLDLLEQSQPLAPQPERVDGAIVYKRFTKAIQENGGNAVAHRNAVIAETEELFGCSVRELYQATGGKRGRRDTLPQPAQEAYMVNESLAANELERHLGSLTGETQDELNDQIAGIVRGQQTRKWLPW